MMGITSLTLKEKGSSGNKELLEDTSRKRCCSFHNRSESLHPGGRHSISSLDAIPSEHSQHGEICAGKEVEQTLFKIA